ncbi:DUF3800 domain-containing protein [Enterococcus sp. 669A]|uniref:DUF3800 domain-containing protein n=1 Tax=Candidatus Enterococcus moelleringii TaxID=2815325 RepID=A0ABS3LHY8_9ENTE|nr:DUF3800 domain-containing protein [Enterococcus sp. 669A]MBO1308673.1 DUF3800 domain-containing protein [Enterococcus sp. 669A]
MQEVFLFFDDSGVLHKNAPNRFFIYAGLIFVGKDAKENAKRRYCGVVKRIKSNKNLEGELKASLLKPSDKYDLYRVLKDEQSMGLTVDISKVHQSILKEKNSIHRFKDYALKRLVKAKMEELIAKGLLDANEDVRINICVDEQATATNGYYNFRDSVYEELKNGIINYNYETFHQPIFFGNVEISVSYCDSKHNYLVQASDILANRLWTSFKINQPSMRNIPNHLCLKLP